MILDSSQHYPRQVCVQSLEKKIPGDVFSLTSEILLVHYARVHLLGEKDYFSLKCRTVNTHYP